MALIICPECAHEVSDKANFCPNCGFPMAKRNADGTNNTESTASDELDRLINENREKSKRSKKIVLTIVSVIIVIVVSLSLAIYLNIKGDDSKAEGEAWAKVEKFQNGSNTDSLDIALHYYMENFVDGKHSEMATQLSERFNSEKNDWQIALAENSVESVNSYMDTHPNGYFRDEAMVRLDSLMYYDALEKNSSEAFDAYLAQFPEGKYAAEAKEKSESLQNPVLTTDEELNVIDILTQHFHALSTNNKGILSATLASTINSYIGKTDATEEDVLAYADKLIEPGKSKTFLPKDFEVTKLSVNGSTIYNLKFVLEETIISQIGVDGQAEDKQIFNGAAVINDELRISSLVLTNQ